MIPATVHIAASLRRNHFISSACSIIALALAFTLGLPFLTSAQVYQDDPAHGRSFNRFRAKIILTPPVFTDSAHLPTLPLYYGSTGKRDSTIGSIAYTRTDDQHWRYTATGWQRMTGGLSIVGGDTTILSQTLDSTGQLQGRALFSGAGFKISSSPYYLYSDALRKLVINTTNISHGGNDKRFVVNGRALINDLYLEAETINSGPPSGSTTYPLGWNPSTQQLEKYTEWPGGISYPLSPGKYLNAYGSFAPLNTDSVPEGSTNIYFSNARARAAIGLTTTGSSGAATYNSSTGILNIPNYTLAGLGGVPTSRTITINGTTLDLSADRSWTISGGGGGTPGGNNKSIQYNNAGNLAGPSTFVYDSANNVVGLGTASPTTLSNYSGITASNITGAFFELKSTSSSGTARFQMSSIATFGTISNHDFYVYTNSTERMRITAGGNIGIDNSTPLNIATYRSITIGNSGLNGGIYEAIGGAVGIRMVADGGSSRGVINVSTNHPLSILVNSTERMRVETDGDVGIGTTAPAISAILDLTSTTKGFLPPRMNASQANAIASKAEGLIVYVTDTGGSPFNFTGKGWWGWNGTTWEKLNP